MVSLVVLFVISAANIFLLLFIVPKFEQIFADALPGKPLPTVTNFIIAGRVILAIAALGWPLLGTYLFRRQKSYAVLLINIGTIWTFLQIGITVIALFMPMVGTTEGMGDHP